MIFRSGVVKPEWWNWGSRVLGQVFSSKDKKLMNEVLSDVSTKYMDCI